MNIWWINEVALPPTEAGGTRHYSFARELIQRGHDVSVVAASFHYVRREELRLGPDEDLRIEYISGVRFLWVRTSPYQESRVRRVWSWLVFALRLLRGTGLSSLPSPDLVIGSSPYPFAALAAERLAHRHGVPFVLEVRDLWPETLVQLGGVSPWHPFVQALRIVERHLYRAAQHIITVLPRGDEYMAARGANKEKVTWIPNAVDLVMIPEASPTREEPPLTIMYAGSHGLSNSLGLLLEAAVLLQENGWNDRVEFHLVGDGPAKSSLVARARREDLANVRFSPPVPKIEVYEILATADAFVLLLADNPLYQWGASPQKLFDYMAVARPILLGCGSPWDPVEEAGCGVSFVPAGASDVAEGVEELAMLTPRERRRMGESARRYVEEHHDLAGLADQLETLLLNLVRAGRTI